MIYNNCPCGNTAGCERCMPSNYHRREPRRFVYDTQKYIIIDGELYKLVDEAPPGFKPLSKDAGIMNVREV